MQDRDTPPAAEGETGGGADVVRPIIAVAVVRAVRDAIAKTTAASTPLRWITTTGRPREATTGTATNMAGDYGRVLRPPTARLSLSHCLCERIRTRVSLLLSTTCSSWPRSRKRRAK